MRRNFCNGFIQSVRDEVDPQLVFFMIRPGFPCMEKVILRTVDTVVQKVKDLFTDFLFTVNIVVWSLLSSHRII
jgi:hypothetical protein